MRDSISLLDELRRTMDRFIGKVFTEEMRQRIRFDVVDIMNTADSEGQAKGAPWICANANTSFCRQCENEKPIENYDYYICQKCSREGGFEI